MTGRSRLLRCYPPAWRERYGDDLAAYLDDRYAGRLPVRAAASVVIGGLRERVQAASPNSAAIPAGARVRAGVLMVLAGWAAFVVAGSSFAKISEHFDTSLSGRARAVPDFSYALVQVVATLSGLAVVAGLGLAVPTFVRFLSAGGWSAIRHHVARAAVATALTAGVTGSIVAWAHQLTAANRNGGNAAYDALLVAWAVLVALTITLWTVATIATGRRLALSRTLLLAEGALATAVATGMLVMLVAAVVWSAALASSAPSFFGGGEADIRSGWNPQVVGTLALMVAALASATVGVIHIARSAPAVIAGRSGLPYQSSSDLR